MSYLEIKPLSVASFANIFSYSVGVLLILSTIFWCEKKSLHLMRFHLFVFAFVSIELGHIPQKILLWFMSKSVPPMFSSRSFMVSSLTCTSLIYLKFLLLWETDLRKYCNSKNIVPTFFLRVLQSHILFLNLLAILSLFLCVAWGSVLTSLIYMQLPGFPLTTCWKDCLFSLVHPCPLCETLVIYSCVSLFLSSLFCSIDLCLFLCQCHAGLITIALPYCLKSGRVILQLCSFSSGLTALAILGFLWFHINFRVICSSSVKNILGNLRGITFNL